VPFGIGTQRDVFFLLYIGKNCPAVIALFLKKVIEAPI